MQPGGKSRLSAKAAYFAKELDEGFLSQVLCFGNILCHAKAQRINSTIMSLVQLFESSHIAAASGDCERMIGKWRRVNPRDSIT